MEKKKGRMGTRWMKMKKREKITRRERRENYETMMIDIIEARNSFWIGILNWAWHDWSAIHLIEANMSNKKN